MKDHKTIGLDIGGTGIKAATVDLSTGRLTVRRDRLPTPIPATPVAVTDTLGKLMDDLQQRSDPVACIGVGFPGVVKSGRVETSAHLDHSWIGTDAEKLFSDRFGTPVAVLNDADAAGLAEVTFGAGTKEKGLVVMVTLGTGIGTGLYYEGGLIPNSELGHLQVDGHDAETRAAASVRERHDLSWKKWGKRVDAYLEALESLLWPELIIIGGGVSTEFEHFAGHLHRRTPVVAATLGNDAGIIGAALWAAQRHGSPAATPPANRSPGRTTKQPTERQGMES